MNGVVVPTGVPGVKSWYDAGARLDGSTVAPVAAPAPVAAAVAAPAPVVEKVPEPVAAPAAPPRKAAWNPEGLNVQMLPGPLQSQFVSDYLKTSPAYLDGSMAGDIGFDPWALAALANPLGTMSGAMDGLQATDKFARTAKDRNAAFMAKSADEQKKDLDWMRASELKHARLAMLACAGWALAEKTAGPYLRIAIDNNGRVPSLFNGHPLEFAGPMFILIGLMSVVEVRNQEIGGLGGDLGFDPMGFGGEQKPRGALPFDDAQKVVNMLPNAGDMNALKTAELKNGRVAMMAITGFAVQEFLWGNPVIEQTPIFF